MPTDLTGKIFGSYKLIEQLGRGGMASVYRGYQETIDRSVAVKVLPPEFLHDPNFTARFLSEARTLAKLTHPSILPLYDFGTANDVPYIVMPLMSHGTLADRLGRGPLSLAEVVRVLTPVAAALDYAHTHGVIHRDIKPSNILFDQNDIPYLADFGIAKALEATTGLTGTGVVGTPDYMSPEQARGELLDGRSDVYSLAVMVYQCLTGTQLFKATTPLGVMMKHATEPPPPVRAMRPDLPPSVDAALQKALAKYPNERYQTASEFIKGLTAVLTGADMATVIEPRPTVLERQVPSTTILPPQARAGTAAAAPLPARRGGIMGWLVAGGLATVVIGVVAFCLGIAALAGISMALYPPATATPIPPTDTPVPPSPTPVPYLLSDDFSDSSSGWSTFSGDKAAVQYSGGEISISFNKTEWFAWSNPGRTFSDVYIEITARNVGGTDDTSFGVMCNYQDKDHYDYLAIDSTGRYAILRYDGVKDTYLSGGGDWAYSNVITPRASSYRIGVACGHNSLTLYVDGTLIDSAGEDLFTSGDIGLFGWTGSSGAVAEIRFDDVTVVELP